MDEFPDDGSGADDGDFNDDVIKAARLHAGQGGHLGAALDLEGADGIGTLHEFVGGGIILRDTGGIDGAASCGTEGEGVFNGCQHAEAEQIDLDDAEVFAVILIPLHDGAARHGGGL